MSWSRREPPDAAGPSARPVRAAARTVRTGIVSMLTIASRPRRPASQPGIVSMLTIQGCEQRAEGAGRSLAAATAACVRAVASSRAFSGVVHLLATGRVERLLVQVHH